MVSSFVFAKADASPKAVTAVPLTFGAALIWALTLSSRSSAFRPVLVGAVLAEQTDEWAEGRRYMNLDALAASRDPRPAPDNPATHLQLTA